MLNTLPSKVTKKSSSLLKILAILISTYVVHNNYVPRPFLCTITLKRGKGTLNYNVHNIVAVYRPYGV